MDECLGTMTVCWTWGRMLRVVLWWLIAALILGRLGSAFHHHGSTSTTTPRAYVRRDGGSSINKGHGYGWTQPMGKLPHIPGVLLAGFGSKEEYKSWLEAEGKLPKGFKVGTTWFSFMPVEANFPSRMNVTLIALDRPTDKFAVVFTKNAFPGAPIRVGRQRLKEPYLQAIVVNNKISNVSPGGGLPDGGVGDAEEVCAAVAKELGLPSASYVLPSSTGVIGWRLPYQAIIDGMPAAVKTLQSASVLPAAEGIVTTDRYPKIRAATVDGGRVVGIAKGAGMIEPNLATMLVYILTDISVPRAVLREWLTEVASESFNCISVDSDMSTSDTVALVSSGQVEVDEAKMPAVKAAIMEVCKKLADDIVRNGEGTNHVIQVTVKNAPSFLIARDMGRAIVNSPLFKCAIAGNDPNVGRLLAAVGKFIGNSDLDIPLDKVRLSMGGQVVYGEGAFQLNPDKEAVLVQHMRDAAIVGELKASATMAVVKFPPHDRNVIVEVDLGQPQGHQATVRGSDLTWDYVTENLSYRS